MASLRGSFEKFALSGKGFIDGGITPEIRLLVCLSVYFLLCNCSLLLFPFDTYLYTEEKLVDDFTKWGFEKA